MNLWGPYKWHCKWITGRMTPTNGVITPYFQFLRCQKTQKDLHTRKTIETQGVRGMCQFLGVGLTSPVRSKSMLNPHIFVDDSKTKLFTSMRCKDQRIHHPPMVQRPLHWGCTYIQKTLPKPLHWDKPPTANFN